MAQFKVNNDTVNTVGELPKIGEKAPDFILTKTDLADVSLRDFEGKTVVLNIFLSVDMPVCSASVRRFNREIGNFPNAVVLCVSLDLPFSHSRFCETEGIKDVIPVCELRNKNFGNDYGVRIAEGPLSGLLARTVIVLNENGTVIYSKLIGDLANEPSYEEILKTIESSRLVAEEDTQACLKSATAEHSRIDDLDEPCDDGRSG